MAMMAAVFLVPKIDGLDLGPAIFFSVLLGLLTFGVFDFTSLALFKSYPIKFALVDTLWGGFVFGVVGTVLSFKFFKQRSITEPTILLDFL